MEDKIERQRKVVEYYCFCNKLKNIIRTGWKNWNVNSDRLESVAEHVFGVQMLAIAMYSEYQYDIDLFKVIFMLAVHELEEIVIGDLTEFEISNVDKQEQGHKAVSQLLSGLLEKELIESLILEFDERKTKEALFAYHCDKLECNLQCKLYDEENCVDMSKQEDNLIFHNEKVQSIIESGESTWSGMWHEYDRDKFVKDENFIEVLDYIKNNKISLVSEKSSN